MRYARVRSKTKLKYRPAPIRRPERKHMASAGSAVQFLRKAPMPVDRACFAVAGPVIDGRAKTTNLPWAMDEDSLAKELNLRSVHLMNDLEAIAEAIPILRGSDVRA